MGETVKNKVNIIIKTLDSIAKSTNTIWVSIETYIFYGI